jgi:hypothetical protein
MCQLSHDLSEESKKKNTKTFRSVRLRFVGFQLQNSHQTHQFHSQTNHPATIAFTYIIDMNLRKQQHYYQSSFVSRARTYKRPQPKSELQTRKAKQMPQTEPDTKFSCQL